MNSSDSLSSRFASTFRDVKIFFGSCLSMHMVPVLFALVLIIVADQKNNTRMADIESHSTIDSQATDSQATDSQATSVPSIKNYVLLNPTDITQVVAIYKVSRLVLKTVR
ncbi:hypothetical protein [Flavitalea sp.]|nr:hypothetical protein [Flavitalea sp.]